MDTPVIVPQRQFASLEDFIENSNNFYAHLVVDCARPRIGRKDRVWPCYERFNQSAPELAAELRKEMTMQNYGRARRGEPWEKVFPWEKVWMAYKIMSNLVYIDDPSVEGKDDCVYLIR
jgi:hypothetical protein